MTTRMMSRGRHWAPGLMLLGLFALVGARGAQAAAPAEAADSLWTVGETGLQIQNVHPGDATEIRARFYDYDGALTHDLRRTVRPGAATNFYLPKVERDAGLIGQSYALVITATRPVAAISRTEFRATGAAVMYSHVEPARDVVVPLAVKSYYGQNTLVSIQNTDATRPAHVRVDLLQLGNPKAVGEVVMSLAPAASGLVDLARDREVAAVPDGFVGWLRLVSDLPVSVQASVHVSASDQAVAAFEGQPAGQASHRLYAPLVRRGWHGTTGIAVVNPSITGAAQVTAQFHGTLGACAGQTFSQGPVTLLAGASAVFYQGPGNQPLTGATPLPEDCGGVAVLEAAGAGILATVMDQDRPDLASAAAAYNAVPAGSGSRRVALPLVRNHHTKADLVTGIQVMNLDPVAPATVRLEIVDSEGAPVPPGPDFTQVVAPLRGATFYLPALAALRGRRELYGSALLTADRPLAVVAVDMSMNGRSDSVAFTGLPAELPTAPARWSLGLSRPWAGLPVRGSGGAR